MGHRRMSTFSTASPKIISRAFGDEVIVANCENGVYYSMVGSAGDIWKGLEAGHSTATIAKQLSSAGGSSEGVAAAVAGFIDRLLTEELIVASDRASSPSPWVPSGQSFVPPLIDRHDDLRDLLMLDPVHEVTEEGWPHRKDNLSEPV